MKNSAFLIPHVILLIIISTSCSMNYKRGDGTIVTSVNELSDFDRIYVGGNYDLTLIKGDDNKVLIRTDENLIPYINVELIEGALNINNVHHLKGSKGISVEVFYKHIKKIHSSGASKITHKGVLQASALDINLSGAGAISLKAETENANINLSGAGVVELSGETDLLEGHISGAGGLLASDFISEECHITLSGLGGAEVFVTEMLTATITGVGGIEYGGNPKVIEKQITGLGKINRAAEFTDKEND